MAHGSTQLTKRDTARLDLFSGIYRLTASLGIGGGTMNLFRAAEILRQFARRHRGKPELDELWALIKGRD